MPTRSFGVRTPIGAKQGFRATQPQMGTRAIWEVKATYVRIANPITTNRKPVVKEKYGQLRHIPLYASINTY
jgi:hypothetical protein